MTGLDILDIIIRNKTHIYLHYIRAAGKTDDVINKITEMEQHIAANTFTTNELRAYLESVKYPEVSKEVYVLLGLR